MRDTKEYEFLSHTADAKFLAHGRTLEGAFSSAAKALASIIADPQELRSTTKHEIAVKGHDEKRLLYGFLEELLFLLDSKFFVLKEVRSMQITKEIEGGFCLKALLVGQTLDGKTKTHEHVKAVTYNEMEITREHGKVTVQVVLDL